MVSVLAGELKAIAGRPLRRIAQVPGLTTYSPEQPQTAKKSVIDWIT